MSSESKICRVLLDVVDVAKMNITTQLLQNSTSMGLTPDLVAKISKVVNAQLDTTFEAGISAIQRELSADAKKSKSNSKKLGEVRSDTLCKS